MPTAPLVLVGLAVLAVLAALFAVLWYVNRGPTIGDTPVADHLVRAAECGHPRPVRPYTLEQARRVMRELRDCTAPTCPAKGLAYQVRVQKGDIQPDVRMDWMS